MDKNAAMNEGLLSLMAFKLAIYFNLYRQCFAHLPFIILNDLEYRVSGMEKLEDGYWIVKKLLL